METGERSKMYNVVLCLLARIRTLVEYLFASTFYDTQFLLMSIVHIYPNLHIFHIQYALFTSELLWSVMNFF